MLDDYHNRSASTWDEVTSYLGPVNGQLLCPRSNTTGFTCSVNMIEFPLVTAGRGSALSLNSPGILRIIFYHSICLAPPLLPAALMAVWEQPWPRNSTVEATVCSRLRGILPRWPHSRP